MVHVLSSESKTTEYPYEISADILKIFETLILDLLYSWNDFSLKFPVGLDGKCKVKKKYIIGLIPTSYDMYN